MPQVLRIDTKMNQIWSLPAKIKFQHDEVRHLAWNPSITKILWLICNTAVKIQLTFV